MVRIGKRAWALLGVTTVGAALISGALLGTTALAGATTSPVSHGAARNSGPPTIKRVLVVGRVSNPTIVVLGSGFGPRPNPDPSTSPSGQQGCPTTPPGGAGHLYGTSFFANDLNAQAGTYIAQQFDAGIFTPGDNGEFDCLGLVITSWTNYAIVFHYGNLYDKNLPGNFYVLSNGDPLQIGVKGTTLTTTVHGLVNTGRPPTTLPPTTTTTTTGPPSTPIISSVSTTGTLVDPTITITGSGFGTAPPADPTSTVSTLAGCPASMGAGPSGFDYGNNLYISDLNTNSGFTAGQYTTSGEAQADCVGLVIESYTDSQIVLQYGNVYDQNLPRNMYVLHNGDPLKVVVKGATFMTTATGLG